MKYLFTLATALVFIGVSCVPQAPRAGDQPQATENTETQAEVVLPVAGYVGNRTYKAFGEYISDRFRGYHVGDDVEFDHVKTEVPVISIAAGVIKKLGHVTGYGGVVVVAHKIDGETVNAIYGHLDLAGVQLKEGDAIKAGEFIANLGDNKSAETDGERKHLHFALYAGDELRLNGYEPTAAGVKRWLNPTDFFLQHGVKLDDYSRAYNLARDLGGSAFKVRFPIPGGMEVEYVPELQALNVFTLKGEGTARERSQLFIRFFDAASFQTLSTVTVYTTESVTVGQGEYPARRYDIEKKPGVPDFPHQPAWRNARHMVTDFARGTGFGRYYVFAKSPVLTDALYQAVLAGVQLVD